MFTVYFLLSKIIQSYLYTTEYIYKYHFIIMFSIFINACLHSHIEAVASQ